MLKTFYEKISDCYNLSYEFNYSYSFILLSTFQVLISPNFLTDINNSGGVVVGSSTSNTGGKNGRDVPIFNKRK